MPDAGTLTLPDWSKTNALFDLATLEKDRNQVNLGRNIVASGQQDLDDRATLRGLAPGLAAAEPLTMATASTLGPQGTAAVSSIDATQKARQGAAGYSSGLGAQIASAVSATPDEATAANVYPMLRQRAISSGMDAAQLPEAFPGRAALLALRNTAVPIGTAVEMYNKRGYTEGQPGSGPLDIPGVGGVNPRPGGGAGGTHAPFPAGTFLADLQTSESPDPTKINSKGYAGSLQFGADRLSDLGFYQPAANERTGHGQNEWKGTFNIPGFPQVRTLKDFLANPDAQAAVGSSHIADIDSAIAATPGSDRMSVDGLRAVAHLGGVGGMQRFVASGGKYDPADSNGTHLSAYYSKFSRLQEHREGSGSGGAPASGAGTVAVGDSLAVGIASANGLPSIAAPSRSPQQVLDSIAAMDSSQVRGRTIVLSSGASNDPRQLDKVEHQIAGLMGKGAARVVLVGVGDRPDLAPLNEQLAAIAQRTHSTFTGALPQTSDGVHPVSYRGLGLGGAPVRVASATGAAGMPQTATDAGGGGVAAPGGDPHATYQAAMDALRTQQAGPGAAASPPTAPDAGATVRLGAESDDGGLASLLSPGGAAGVRLRPGADPGTSLQIAAQAPNAPAMGNPQPPLDGAAPRIALPEGENELLQLMPNGRLAVPSGGLRTAPAPAAMAASAPALTGAPAPTVNGGPGAIAKAPPPGAPGAPYIPPGSAPGAGMGSRVNDMLPYGQAGLGADAPQNPLAALAMPRPAPAAPAGGGATPTTRGALPPGVALRRDGEGKLIPVQGQPGFVEARDQQNRTVAVPLPGTVNTGRLQAVPRPDGGHDYVSPSGEKAYATGGNTRDVQVQMFKEDRDQAQQQSDTAMLAQQQQGRLLEARQVLQHLPQTGANGETRAAWANFAETYMDPQFAAAFKSKLGLPDAVPAQEFGKLMTQSAGQQERAVAGSRGGIQMMQLFRSANPGLEMRPEANRDILNMQLVATQADQDYAKGHIAWVNEHGRNFLGGAGEYEPASRYDQQWIAQRNPQIYLAATNAMNGKPFETWAKSLKPDDIARVRGVIEQIDPSTTVLGPGGRSFRVSAGQSAASGRGN